MLNSQYLLSELLFSCSGSSSSNPFKGYITVLLEQAQASTSAKDEEFVFPHLCGVVGLQTLLQACLLQPAVQEAEDGVYVIRPKVCQNVLLSARSQQGQQLQRWHLLHQMRIVNHEPWHPGTLHRRSQKVNAVGQSVRQAGQVPGRGRTLQE